MPAAARKTQLQVTHEISASFTATGIYTQAQLTAGVQIGSLPAGAVAEITHVLAPIAWNGTVSTVFNVGTTPLGTQLIAGTDVRTAPIRADTMVPITSAGPYAVDTPIYASFVFGGTLGTLGQTVVVVEYIPTIG